MPNIIVKEAMSCGAKLCVKRKQIEVTTASLEEKTVPLILDALLFI